MNFLLALLLIALLISLLNRIKAKTLLILLGLAFFCIVSFMTVVSIQNNQGRVVPGTFKSSPGGVIYVSPSGKETFYPSSPSQPVPRQMKEEELSWISMGPPAPRLTEADYDAWVERNLFHRYLGEPEEPITQELKDAIDPFKLRYEDYYKPLPKSDINTGYYPGGLPPKEK